jgi:adenine C2-methylase RlmN of 23S rRNA A2503 and tRNA A37
MCHLTATGQTSIIPASIADYVSQVRDVLDAVEEIPRDIRRIDIAFMAQGDPLLNPHVVNDWASLQVEMENVIKSRFPNFEQPIFKISTIFPVAFVGELPFERDTVVYYSLYGLDMDFRKRWLPRAAAPNFALGKLHNWQFAKSQGREIVIHGPFIDGENDSTESVTNMILKVYHTKFRDIRFNVVRYNPPNERSRESLRLDEIEKEISTFIPLRVVPRVGKDVHAACGTFSQIGAE